MEGKAPQTTRGSGKLGSSDGGVRCHGSRAVGKPWRPLDPFRRWPGLAEGKGDPGLEGRITEDEAHAGEEGLHQADEDRKAEPVGLKWTLFLSGQEVRKARSGSGDLEDGDKHKHK